MYVKWRSQSTKRDFGNEAKDDKRDRAALYGSLKHNLHAIYRTTASGCELRSLKLHQRRVCDSRTSLDLSNYIHRLLLLKDKKACTRP